jgi:hypothetical protein
MRHSTATVIELNAAKRIDFEAVWTRNKKSNAYIGLKIGKYFWPLEAVACLLK